LVVNAWVSTASGTVVPLTGNVNINPYPPHQVSLSGASFAGESLTGVRFEIYHPSLGSYDPMETFQGFIFHVREAC
jgi:hypothetical protein